MTITRTCTTCKIEYPATLEHFYKQPRGKYGLKPTCKSCNNKSMMEYYNANKERLQLSFHFWQKNNRDKRRAIRRRERAKTAGVLNDDWTDEQLISTYGTDCYICDEPIDFNAPKKGIGSDKSYWPDHLIPMSKGGDNIISNVRPCHAQCNRSKGVKTYEEYTEE